jgi:BMFP domain-containing protein YqiC
MQTSNRVLDDLAKVANGAVSTLVGIKGELEALMRQQFERLVERMDLVPREEFDAVRAVAQKARAEQEKLERRVAALEARLAGRARPSAGGKNKKKTRAPRARR